VTLQRFIIAFNPNEIVLHTLYTMQDGADLNTKARYREGTVLARTSLTQALEALKGGAECVGTSGLTMKEDVLLATSSLDADKLVKRA
jgi:hypothetical protein